MAFRRSWTIAVGGSVETPLQRAYRRRPVAPHSEFLGAEEPGASGTDGATIPTGGKVDNTKDEGATIRKHSPYDFNV